MILNMALVSPSVVLLISYVGAMAYDAEGSSSTLIQRVGRDFLYGYSTHVTCQELAVEAAKTSPPDCDLPEPAQSVMGNRIVDSFNVHHVMVDGQKVKDKASFDCRVKQDFQRCPADVLQTMLDGTHQLKCFMGGLQVYIENEDNIESSSGLCLSSDEVASLLIQRSR